MMRNRDFLVGALLTLAALAASLILYPSLPEMMPIHWNIRGEVDGYAPKVWGAFIGPGMMLVALIFLRLLPWLSPRHFEVDTFRSTYAFAALLTVALLGYIHALILWASLAGSVDVGRALLGGIFLFFALLGNVLGKVRRNFWIGVRTPWTLADERVWNDTHRFAARLYVAIGVAGLVAVAAGASFAAAIVLLLVGSFVPVVYSLARYKEVCGNGAGASRKVWVVGGLLLAAVAVALWVGTRAASGPPSREVPPPPELADRARQMVRHMAEGSFEAAEEHFDATMRRALPPEKLQETWQSLEQAHGPFRETVGIRAEQTGQFIAIFVTTRFERGTTGIKVVFGNTGLVSGLWFKHGVPYRARASAVDQEGAAGPARAL